MMLSDFWCKYQEIKPDFQLAAGLDRKFCVPIAIHGDEGRGKVKCPIMILAWQPLISWRGPEFVNIAGSTLTTRLLYTAIPSELYAGERTLQTLLGALADDLNKLYMDGQDLVQRTGRDGLISGLGL